MADLIGFDAATIQLPIPCIPSFLIPIPVLNLRIPPFSFFFPFPFPTLQFSFSCDFGNPIDISAGIAYGGGREARFDFDPDQADQ